LLALKTTNGTKNTRPLPPQTSRARYLRTAARIGSYRLKIKASSITSRSPNSSPPAAPRRGCWPNSLPKTTTWLSASAISEWDHPNHTSRNGRNVFAPV